MLTTTSTLAPLTLLVALSWVPTHSVDDLFKNHAFWDVTPGGEQSDLWLQGGHEEDMAPLTRIAQAFIHRGQNPGDCSTAEFLTGAAYAVPNQGIGGVVHVASLTLLVRPGLSVGGHLSDSPSHVTHVHGRLVAVAAAVCHWQGACVYPTCLWTVHPAADPCAVRLV
jgi:hypothetical protein